MPSARLRRELQLRSKAIFDGTAVGAQDRASMIETKTVTVGDQPLRVGIHRGSSHLPPLLAFNGIGANLELVAPFAGALRATDVSAFDLTRAGASPRPTLP